MNQIEYQRELLSYEEKVVLAELEVVKAQERVAELKYAKARFNFDFINLSIKAQQQAQQQAQQAAPVTAPK